MQHTAVEQFSLLVQTSIALGLLAVTAAKTNDGWNRSTARSRAYDSAFFAKVQDGNTRSTLQFRSKKGS